jgi:hypothetical protein
VRDSAADCRAHRCGVGRRDHAVRLAASHEWFERCGLDVTLDEAKPRPREHCGTLVGALLAWPSWSVVNRDVGAGSGEAGCDRGPDPGGGISNQARLA